MPKYSSRPDASDVADALKSPRDFGYSGNLPIFDTWSLGPVILTRGSDTLGQSNAAAIKAAFLADFGPEGEESGWEVTVCNHWAVGWVEHLSFRAVSDNGEPSDQLRCMMDINAALADYPVLDESDYSEREYDGQCEQIRDAARRWVNTGSGAAGWESYVFDVAWDSDAREWRRFFEDSDNYGPPEGRIMAETCARACVAWLAADPTRTPGAFLDQEAYTDAGYVPLADGSITDSEGAE